MANSKPPSLESVRQYSTAILTVSNRGAPVWGQVRFVIILVRSTPVTIRWDLIHARRGADSGLQLNPTILNDYATRHKSDLHYTNGSALLLLPQSVTITAARTGHGSKRETISQQATRREHKVLSF